MFKNKIRLIYSKSNPFYYGWIILAISSLGYFFSGPGQTYFISVFIDNYIRDFGWDRSTVSTLYSLATLLSGLLLFLVGRLADKYGQKKMIIIVALLLGASCVWNSYISSLWMLFIGFFISRLTGQGSMTLLPSIVLPQWFDKKRAFAFSIMSMGGVIGSAVIPPFNTWLISISSWNTVWIIWALLLCLFYVPLVAAFHYNKPHDIGLLPDNRIIDAVKEVSSLHIDSSLKSWTLKEAMHTFSFWGMLFCQALLPMIITGIVFHFFSILGSKDVPASSAAFILSLFAIVSFPITLIAGAFLDRFKMNHVIAFISALQLVGLTTLLLSNSIQAIIAFAVIQGMAMGLQSVSGGLVWPNYYGLANLGSIRGFAMTATVIASAVGPIPFGIAFDLFGTYQAAIILMIVFSGAGILTGWLSTKPEKI